MIQVSSLGVKKGSHSILTDISLSIPNSGVHGLVGANGAGKTTLLKSLAFCDFSNGSLTIDSHLLEEIPVSQRARLITYAGEAEFQTSKLSVSQIIDYSRYGSDSDPEYKERLIYQFELTQLLNREVASLSGGEKQRLNLLCSLYQDSEYVFWDEPTNFLDPRHVDLLEEVLEEHSKNKSFIIVSHDLNFLMEVSSELYALKKGKLLFQSTSEEVFLGRKLDEVFEKKFLYLESDDRRIIR